MRALTARSPRPTNAAVEPEKFGDARSRAVTLTDVADLEWIRGDRARVFQVYDDALRVARRLGDTQLVCQFLLFLGRYQLAARRVADGHASLSEAFALARAMGARPWVAVAARALAEHGLTPRP